jgi:hypothetical protein
VRLVIFYWRFAHDCVLRYLFQQEIRVSFAHGLFVYFSAQPSKAVSRTLILIAKTLQILANGVQPGEKVRLPCLDLITTGLIANIF